MVLCYSRAETEKKPLNHACGHADADRKTRGYVRAPTRTTMLLHCNNPDPRTGDFARDIYEKR